MLAQRTADGLVKGGEDVSWVSTQHNLLTVGMLRDLVDQIGAGNQEDRQLHRQPAQHDPDTIGNAILSKLSCSTARYV